MRTRKRIDKRGVNTDLTPQKRKRSLITNADTYDQAKSIVHSMDAIDSDEIQIRRIRKGYAVYHRVLIAKKEKREKKNGISGA
jgi:hypothetical protein